MFKDLVVLIPGITGSSLARQDGDASTPIWDLSVGTLWEFLVHNAASVRQLKVPDHDPQGAAPETDVVATGLVKGFHGIYGLGRISGYVQLHRQVAKSLKLIPGSAFDSTPANLIEFPYDWRLSCRYSAQKLREVVDHKLGLWRDYVGEPKAKTIFIAHSMGGLVARYYLEVLGRDGTPGDGHWRDCTALVTFGTPYRGSVDAVEYVANGYKKLFLDLTEVVRTCPSVYELMPIYPCIEQGNNWGRPAELSLPKAVNRYVRAAKNFHDEIKHAVEAHENEDEYLKNRYRIFPFVGVGQSTLQSAKIVDQVLATSVALPSGFDPALEGGDGTVPRCSATPIELSEDYRETFLGEQHGFLHSNAASLDDVVYRLKQLQVRSGGLRAIQGGIKSRENYIDIQVDDVFGQEEPVIIRCRTSAAERDCRGLEAVIERTDCTDTGLLPLSRRIVTEAGSLDESIEGLPPGQYKLTVRVPGGTAADPAPAHSSFEVSGEAGYTD